MIYRFLFFLALTVQVFAAADGQIRKTMSRPIAIRDAELINGYGKFYSFFAGVGEFFSPKSETPEVPEVPETLEVHDDFKQLARRSESITCEEPEDVGGAECTDDSECNGRSPSLYGDNVCEFPVSANGTAATTGYCSCAYDYAKTDCSYKRFDKNLAGGLEFLAFAGIGGVGNFVADRVGEGVGQLILLIAPYLMCCFACCLFAGDAGAAIAVVTQVGLGCACLAGFIWCMCDAGFFLGGQYPDGNGYYPYNGDCIFVIGYSN